VLSEVKLHKRSIVLFHDSNGKTVAALDGIIKELKNSNYSFGKLTKEVEPIVFKIKG